MALLALLRQRAAVLLWIIHRDLEDEHSPGPPSTSHGENVVQGRFNEKSAAAAYGTNPLAADVRYRGNRMLEKAHEELAQFYPPDPDGTVPVAYLWSRTVPCPNCPTEMPLIRQCWLARTDKRKVRAEAHGRRRARARDARGSKGDGIPGWWRNPRSGCSRWRFRGNGLGREHSESRGMHYDRS